MRADFRDAGLDAVAAHHARLLDAPPLIRDLSLGDHPGNRKPAADGSNFPSRSAARKRRARPGARRSRRAVDFSPINRAVLASLPLLLRMLLPGGRIVGREYAVLMAIEDAERFVEEPNRYGSPRFDLEIGPDIEIARKVVERLEDLYGPIIVCEGRLWRFDKTHWAALDDDHVVRFVHRADGTQYVDRLANSSLSS